MSVLFDEYWVLTYVEIQLLILNDFVYVWC
jgi:hypothetical protein